MHPLALRRTAVGLLGGGKTLSAVSKQLDESRAALPERRELPNSSVDAAHPMARAAATAAIPEPLVADCAALLEF